MLQGDAPQNPAGASTGKISGMGLIPLACPEFSSFCPEFGKIGKIVPKMLRILGILAYQSLIDM